MKEKEQLDPNEMMENGLTRAHNEKIQKDVEGFNSIMSLISMGLIIYALSLIF